MEDLKFNPDGSPEYRVNLNWNNGSHTFLLRGGILQHPDKCSAATGAIGYALAQWARLETHIDTLIYQLNRKEFFPSDEKSPRPHPGRFADKIDLLKKLFRHPAILHLKAEIGAIATSLVAQTPGKNDSKVAVRNVLAHSILADVNEETFTMILHSFKVDHVGDVELAITTIGFKQLGSFCRDLDILNFNLSGVSCQIFAEETLERLRKFAPQIPPESH